MKRVAFPVTLMVFAILFVTSIHAATINVTYNVNTEGDKTPISKYVYGSNWGSGTDYTIRRSGGNRLTAYNWENNFSNAGSDYGPYHNDNYMVRFFPEYQQLIPGLAITDFQDTALSQGQASIVTLQMAGYVSADGDGNVDLDTEAAPSARFKQVVFAKGAPFCSPYDNPNTSDDYVYMDEFVNFLVNEYGNASTSTGVKFYDLDNEPALWSDGNKGATHPEAHPAKPTCTEIKTNSIALSTAAKNIDPYAQILGPVLYGFSAYLDFQGASDWSSVKGSRPWFVSYYLDEMEAASASAGRRLLDVLDIHWYPEAQDNANHRILQDISTDAMYIARMQAPRTLWDSDYVSPSETYPNGEVSWINQWYFAQYLPLIPRLKSDISTYYPDTNLAFTEYAYGPDSPSHWSTGIATADFLGICGKYGVYIATYWGGNTYTDAAIKIYRNYDGSHSTFGDVNVPATMSDKFNSSIYASVFDDSTCELHLIVINKNIDDSISGTFNISSPQSYTSGRVWKFDNNSSNITETTSISSITSNSFIYTIPKTTACHIVLQADPYTWDLSGDCHVNIEDLGMFADGWLDETDSYDFGDFASFGQEWGL